MSDIENVKKLREATGAGFKDCNLAIKESGGDIDKAIEILRVKGISKASKKMSRDAKEGVIAISGNEKKTSIIAGIAEQDENRSYNSAVVIGPNGYLGKYRKIHLFGTEKNCFNQGNLPLKIFDIGSARVGVMICFDWRFPETARTLALGGADLIAHPSNLVLPHCPQAIITRCLENRIFAITADRVGEEERIPGEKLNFIGQSQVVDPDGNILVRASETEEEVHIVDIDLKKARDKYLNSQNEIFKDRRTDLYL